MNISIGNDHAGVDYKNYIIKNLEEKYNIVNHGTDDTNSVDYPDFAHPVSLDIDNRKSDFGVLICGSGNGVAMTANKYKKVRAALCWSEEIAKLAKQHNNANVVCIPARFISKEDALQIVRSFIDTKFEGGRHERRVNKI
jgi:ribose 5-phosphate isomerase B